MVTTVYLIRHGETDWNRDGRWQGFADVPLNERGRLQSALVAQRIFVDGIRFDALYCSDLTRAYQTAWEIGSAIRVPVQLLPPLREIDLGTWSGLTSAELRARYPVEMALLDQGQDVPRGGGETLWALRRRVVEAVDAMVAQHPGETLGLVTHGGPIRMLLSQANNYDADVMPQAHQIINTSITVMRCDDGTWLIESINDCAHLMRDPNEQLISSPVDDADQPL